MKIEERDIKAVLRHLGIAPHWDGYRYLTTAVKMVVDNPHATGSVVETVYVGVAGVYGTSKHRVERSIRHAIEESYSYVPLDVLERLLGNTVHSYKGKPTNKQYIVTVADAIRDGQYDKVIKACRCEEVP